MPSHGGHAHLQVGIKHPLVVQVEQERRVHTIINLATPVRFGLAVHAPTRRQRRVDAARSAWETHLRNQLASVLAQELVFLDALLRAGVSHGTESVCATHRAFTKAPQPDTLERPSSRCLC